MAGDPEDPPVVLTVDDDEEVIETYELWLGDTYELRTATGGEEALEQLDESVDVVLLDRLMPDMAGEQVLEAIRDSGVDCQVAMATAVEPDDDIGTMPFDAYVMKALERESVQETIEQLLARSDADDPVQEHYAVAEKLAALESAKPASDLEDSSEYQQLRERFEELDVQLSESETTFTREELVDTIDEIESGPEATGDERGSASDPPPEAYDLLSGTGAEATRPVPPGTTVLVSAPMAAGREFVVHAIERGLRDGEGGLVVTTNQSTRALIEAIDAPTDLLRVVDCQSEGGRLDDDHPVVVQDVDTPRNLTDIGIGFTNAFLEFDDTGADRGRFGLLSLSVVLGYVSTETAYRFCQTLSRGLDQEGFVGFFLLGRHANDEQTENTLRRAVDGLVEIRAAGDGHEMRVTGIEGTSTEWVTLP